MNALSGSRGRSRSRLLWTILAAALALAGRSAAFQAPALAKAQQADLKANFALCKSKLKGPYGDNYCKCPDGRKQPVQVDSRITSPCGSNAVYCAAYRAPWAEALGRQRMWIANIFARDLDQWESFTDHHDLVRDGLGRPTEHDARGHREVRH